MPDSVERVGQPPDVVLDATVLDRLYPSHLRVDTGFRVVGAGRVIDRLLPRWRGHPRLDELFTLERPAGVGDFAGLVAARDQALVLTAIDLPAFQLKGEILPIATGSQAVLLLVPWLNDPRTLERIDLTVGDFAIGDATPDLIFLVETQATLLDQLKAMNERLKAARDAALAASRAKSEFLANASHELRTPLNAIIGFSEYLVMFGKAAPAARMAEYVGAIHQSGHYLLDVVNDLLDLARIEADRQPFEELDLDLPALLVEMSEWIRPQAERQSVTVALEASASPLRVRADPGLVRQILVNLLSNAVKFNRRGGTVRLTLRSARDGWIEIEVADSGIGVDPKIIPELFKPFRQADSFIARRYGGTGLGLHIVQRLARLHDGDVEMESTPGRGTTVRLRLPPGRVLPPGGGL